MFNARTCVNFATQNFLKSQVNPAKTALKIGSWSRNAPQIMGGESSGLLVLKNFPNKLSGEVDSKTLTDEEIPSYHRCEAEKRNLKHCSHF